MSAYRNLQGLARLVKLALLLCALLFIAQLALPLTGAQGHWARWLAASEYAADDTVPEAIIVLGGGGIPSESGLIRTWHGADAAQEFTNALVIVSLPADEDPEANSVGRMKQELVMRGVDENRILMETRALNTREQAVNILALLGEGGADRRLMLVSSGYHLRRSVLCFEKAGFQNVQVRAASSVGAEADFGGWTYLRYGLWADLEAQPAYLREMIALLTYRLRGWI